MSKQKEPFVRPHAAVLTRRLAEPRRFIQVVAGPRQVGKTTLVQQVMERSDLATHFASADEPTLQGPEWIAQQWEAARLASSPLSRWGLVRLHRPFAENAVLGLIPLAVMLASRRLTTP